MRYERTRNRRVHNSAVLQTIPVVVRRQRNCTLPFSCPLLFANFPLYMSCAVLFISVTAAVYSKCAQSCRPLFAIVSGECGSSGRHTDTAAIRGIPPASAPLRRRWVGWATGSPLPRGATRHGSLGARFVVCEVFGLRCNVTCLNLNRIGARTEMCFIGKQDKCMHSIFV